MDAVVRKLKAIPWPYATKDLAALAQLEGRIIQKAKTLSLITYSDLVRDVEFRLPNINNGQPYKISVYEWSGLDRRIIGDFLAYASLRSYEPHGFMLNALVVNKQEYRPSDQFFKFMEYLGVLDNLEEDTVLSFWMDQVNKAHQHYGRSGRRTTR